MSRTAALVWGVLVAITATGCRIGFDELDQEPVARWVFDEGAGNTVADLSPNHNDCTLQGVASAPAWIARSDGYALQFPGDGASFADCGADPSLLLTDAVSIAALVRFDTFSAWESIVGNGLYGLFHRGEWAGDTVYFVVSIEEAAGAGDSGWGNGATAHTSSQLVAGEWHHLVGIKDGEAFAIYLDGVREKYWSCDACLTPNAAAMQSLLFGSNAFLGALDEVAIYGRALGEAEVQQLYLDAQ